METPSETSKANEFFENLIEEMAVIMPSMANNELKSSRYAQSIIEMMLEQGITKRKQVLKGIDALREWSIENDFAPPPARFVSWCLPTPEDYGLPDSDTAYRYAVSHQWVHSAIYEAYKRVGSFEMRTKPEAWTSKAFKSEYERVCREVINGTQFDLPKTDNILPAPVLTDEEKQAIKEKAEQARKELFSRLH